MKKTIVTLLSLILILVNCVPCFAENQSAPPVGQISSNPNSAHYAWRNPVAVCADDELAFTYLECGIDLSGSSSVQITSTTETNILADYTIILTIQQWKNNEWNYYTERAYIAHDRTSLTVSNTVSVESGYYYRLMVTHRVDTMEAMRVASTTTSSIYVN